MPAERPSRRRSRHAWTRARSVAISRGPPRPTTPPPSCNGKSARRMAERLDVVKLAPARHPRRGLRHRRRAGRSWRSAIRMPATSRSTWRCRCSPRRRREGAASGAPRSHGILSALSGGASRRCRIMSAATSARLPFAAGAFDLAWSNLALQWADDLPQALGRARPRAARQAGSSRSRRSVPTRCASCAPPSPESDRHSHVSRFIDMHDIGDMLVGAGLRRSGDADGIHDADLRRRVGDAARPEGDRRHQRDARRGRAR